MTFDEHLLKAIQPHEQGAGVVGEFQPDVNKAWERMDFGLKPIPSTNPWIRNVTWLAAAIGICVIGIKYIPVTFTPATKTYTTQVAQRATITLDDGTTAILAPSTILRVTGRNADVTGQALFTVASNKSNPFTITAGSTNVRVLGTTFSVRKYAEEQSTQVVVAEGKVSVNNSVVTTGEIAAVSNGANPTITRNDNVSAILGWAQGRLVFNDVPVSQVFAELSRWYGVDIRGSKDMLSEYITVELAAETASQATQFIATFLDATVERRGNVVFLRRNR